MHPPPWPPWPGQPLGPSSPVCISTSAARCADCRRPVSSRRRRVTYLVLRLLGSSALLLRVVLAWWHEQRVVSRCQDSVPRIRVCIDRNEDARRHWWRRRSKAVSADMAALLWHLWHAKVMVSTLSAMAEQRGSTRSRRREPSSRVPRYTLHKLTVN